MLLRSRVQTEPQEITPSNIKVCIQGSSLGFGFGAFTLHRVDKNTVLGPYLGRTCALACKDKGYKEDYVYSAGEHEVDAFENGLLRNVHGAFTEQEALAMPQRKRCGMRAEWVAKHTNWTRFINHANRPWVNLEAFRAHEKSTVVLFRTTVDIPAGSELFVSYGKQYWVDSNCKPVQPTLHPERPYERVALKRGVFVVDPALRALSARARRRLRAPTAEGASTSKSRAKKAAARPSTQPLGAESGA